MASLQEKQSDVEAVEQRPVSVADNNADVAAVEAVRTYRIQHSVWILRKLCEGEEWLDRKMGVETQGVNRIPEEEKRPPSTLNLFLIWWSLNLHVGSIALGMLGPQFGLSLKQAVAATIIGTALGSTCPAYTGTLGPKLGLRQICCARYAFGFWGAKLGSVLNVVIGGGFGVVNYVVVGQLLSAVSNYTMSITVGIVIIAVLSFIISTFGFHVIHTVEKYLWIATFIVTCVLIGQAAPHIDSSIPQQVHGLEYYGAFLSILAINFSNTSSWASIVADYYCNYPASTPPWKIWQLSFWGNTLSSVWAAVVGACLANTTQAYHPWGTTYTNHGLGGLIHDIYHPIGWSKFCLVLLTFSVLGNCVGNNYSSGLSVQLLGDVFHAVPRFIWSLINVVVVALLAIAGQQHLSTIISNFVSLLGYWAISFTFIILIEDKWFRRHSGYDLAAWDNPRKLPWGAAALVALLCGYLIGGLLGMAQKWWVGPIALEFGPYGGDVGIYLSGAIAIVVYFPARSLERSLSGR